MPISTKLLDPKRPWPRRLFRKKHTGNLIPGELIWRGFWPERDTAYGPYRVEKIDPQCPGQVHVSIVGMEASGRFGIPWGTVLVPRYR